MESDEVLELREIAAQLKRIADAQERLAEATKIGGALDALGRSVRVLADAVNRNTNLGGRS